METKRGYHGTEGTAGYSTIESQDDGSWIVVHADGTKARYGSPSQAAFRDKAINAQIAGTDAPKTSPDGWLYWHISRDGHEIRTRGNGDGTRRARKSGSAALRAEETALMAENDKIMTQIKSLRARRDEIAARLADLPALIEAAAAAEAKADAEAAEKVAEKTIKSEAAAMAAFAKVAKMIPADKLAAMLAAMSSAADAD